MKSNYYALWEVYFNWFECHQSAASFEATKTSFIFTVNIRAIKRVRSDTPVISTSDRLGHNGQGLLWWQLAVLPTQHDSQVRSGVSYGSICCVSYLDMCPPCATHHALCTMHCAPCTVHHALCTMHCAPCTMHCAPCTVHHALCTISCHIPETVQGLFSQNLLKCILG